MWLNIWDLPGDSKHDLANKKFYKGSDGIILVFDLTKNSSFDNIEILYQDLLPYSQDAVFMLVGNKSDKTNHRKVTRRKAEDYAGIRNMLYIETSVKNNTNIIECFHGLMLNIIKKN